MNEPIERYKEIITASGAKVMMIDICGKHTNEQLERLGYDPCSEEAPK